MTAQRWPEDVGSVGEEAVRLLESLRRAGLEASAPGPRAADAGASSGPAASGPSPRPPSSAADEGVGPVGADGDPSGGERPGAAGASAAFACDDPVCQWCPVCRASAFVRRLSPETLGGLAELAGVAAAVLSDLAGARARQDEEAATGVPAPDAAGAAGAAGAASEAAPPAATPRRPRAAAPEEDPRG
ncbi:hypothetical protein [Nostocoides sp. Soil756]|uniref:hypothetical protein n=1 Tax=Nostocoides sp. Soil756 TaxID=1736399 RepID=UPI0006F93CBC|nr:hypothetical protein [Tetrasphaera sp. Soil756]KRE63023.1 hypothetical protein ASG78_08770 [Tetrasphaera sp. Soil756]